MSDCLFDGNSAEGTGAGISVFGDEPAVVSIVDTVIQNSTASTAGALYIRADSHELSIEGSSIISNVSTQGYAGGVGLEFPASLLVTNSSFTENHGAQGGAISVLAESELIIELADSSFSSNGTDYDGGVLQVYRSDPFDELPDATISIDNCSFTDNVAEHEGGVLHLGGELDYSVLVSNSQFSDNSAVQSKGGAIEMIGEGDTSIAISHSSFEGNCAVNVGSALHVSYEMGLSHRVDATLESVTFDANENFAEAGAVTIGRQTDLTVTSCTFTSNTGGGIYMWDEPTSRLFSVDSDFGTAGTDTTPWDVMIRNGPTYDTFGANETFECQGGGECI